MGICMASDSSTGVKCKYKIRSLLSVACPVFKPSYSFSLLPLESHAEVPYPSWVDLPPRCCWIVRMMLDGSVTWTIEGIGAHHRCLRHRAPVIHVEQCSSGLMNAVGAVGGMTVWRLSTEDLPSSIPRRQARRPWQMHRHPWPPTRPCVFAEKHSSHLDSSFLPTNPWLGPLEQNLQAHFHLAANISPRACRFHHSSSPVQVGNLTIGGSRGSRLHRSCPWSGDASYHEDWVRRS